MAHPWRILVQFRRLPAMQEMGVLSLGQENSLEKGMASHSSIFAYQIPWIEEPGKLESMGSQESHRTAIRSPPPLLLVRNLTSPFPLVRLTDFKISVSRVQYGTNNSTSIDLSNFWFLLWPILLWHVIQQEPNYLRSFRNEPKSLVHYCSISDNSLRTAFDSLCVLWILWKESSKCMYEFCISNCSDDFKSLETFNNGIGIIITFFNIL